MYGMTAYCDETTGYDLIVTSDGTPVVGRYKVSLDIVNKNEQASEFNVTQDFLITRDP